MAGLMTYSLSKSLPDVSNPTPVAKDVSKIYKRSFTAAGLFGTYTQFPFNPNDENLHPKPIRDKDKEKNRAGKNNQ